MYENALDWEHLPHLHASSFLNIDVLDSGGWGWRAAVTGANGGQSVLELRLDKSCRRWITRNLEGPNQGAEIWTHVFVEAAKQLDIVVDFFVPGVAAQSREKVGQAYARQYETLYDEDVWMMTERQTQIDRRLGKQDKHEQRVLARPDVSDLPLPFEFASLQFMLNRFADDWVVYPAVCPHQMGPLTGELSTTGEIHCPWHGYSFDVVSGACTSGGNCRLGRVPQVLQNGDELILSWGAD